MIFEYAIEPELVATWGTLDKYRYFIEQVGLGTPRIMSDYPEFLNWRRRVLQAAEVFKNTNDHSRILELIRKFGEKTIPREKGEYDDNIPWLENAEKEHINYPFQAILARQKRGGSDDILTENSLHTESKWKVKRGNIIPKKAQEMAEVVAAMLRNCTVAIFIDPHFGPENSRHRRPLQEFLHAMVKNRRGLLPQRVEVHTSDKVNFDFFKNNCEEKMPAIIPRGLRVLFKRWKQKSGGDRLHPRFIITDIGGVKFDDGLDQKGDGITEIVNLLDIDQYRKIWDKYASDRPAFDPADEPVGIIGTAYRVTGSKH